jgi:arabinogalactan endo-1,4-beta-galactosidase
MNKPSNSKLFIKGADVSTLQQIEACGGKFFDTGREMDCLEILKNHGINFIRLKVWNNPGLPTSDPAGYNDKKHVLQMAKRVKAAGMGLLIDFHYSDFWADPQSQSKPKSWAHLDFKGLQQAVYDYTKEVITDLQKQNTLPEMVQIGNEISNGFMWDDGKLDGITATAEQWAKFVDLLKSGLAGLKDSLKSGEQVQRMIHIDKGGDKEFSCYFFDNILARGVDFEIVGQSYYSEWHGTMDNLKENLNHLASSYDQDLIIVETAYPWTAKSNGGLQNKVKTSLEGYPLSVEGQTKFLKDIIMTLKNVPKGAGTGLFYWEPGFISVEGAGWKYGEGNEWANMTLFDFEGHSLESMDEFK